MRGPVHWMHIRAYSCSLRAHLFTCEYTCAHIRTSVHTCAHMYRPALACAHLRTPVLSVSYIPHICIHIRAHVLTCVHMYTPVCLCVLPCMFCTDMFTRVNSRIFIHADARKRSTCTSRTFTCARTRSPMHPHAHAGVHPHTLAYTGIRRQIQVHTGVMYVPMLVHMRLL
jgi:hypothetical protein